MGRLSRAGRRRDTLRAVQMIEFALVFPVLLAFLILTVDMGTAVLRYAGLQDAASTTARASAQAGGAFIANSLDGNPSETGAGSPWSVSWRTMQTAADNIPGAPKQVAYDPAPGAADTVGFRVLSGGLCQETGENSFVTVEAYYTPKFMTPGIQELLNMIGADADTDWSLKARAVSRCEVVLNSQIISGED